MTTNPQLLNALLAMDVYHRGVPGGLFLLVPDTQIDDTIRGKQSPDADNAIGFFAQSYTFNGQTIIAYRGTDAGANTNAPLTATSACHSPEAPTHAAHWLLARHDQTGSKRLPNCAD